MGNTRVRGNDLGNARKQKDREAKREEADMTEGQKEKKRKCQKDRVIKEQIDRVMKLAC